MAMTKAEKAALEVALTECALRRTAEVKPDVPPPGYGSGLSVLTRGFAVVGERSDYPRIDEGCSSSIFHSVRSTTKTDTQGPISLYSTRLKALRALRYRVELQCAQRLRKIDKMIEEEELAEGDQEK